MGYRNLDPLPPEGNGEPLEAPSSDDIFVDFPWIDLACRLFLWLLVAVAGALLFLR